VPGQAPDARAQVDDPVTRNHVVEFAGELGRCEERAVQGAAHVRGLVEVVENEFPLLLGQVPFQVDQFAHPVVLLGLLLAELSGHGMPPFAVVWGSGPDAVVRTAAGRS
jgi:hypothetical protein